MAQTRSQSSHYVRGILQFDYETYAFFRLVAAHITEEDQRDCELSTSMCDVNLILVVWSSFSENFIGSLETVLKAIPALTNV